MSSLIKILPTAELNPKFSPRKSFQSLTSLIMSARRLSGRKSSASPSARKAKRFSPRRFWRVAIIAARFAVRAKRLSCCVRLVQEEKDEIVAKFYSSEVILDHAGVHDFIAKLGQQLPDEELSEYLRWTLYKAGHAITLRQLMSLMTQLKRKHVSAAVADTREAFDALATNGRIAADTLKQTIKQFDLKVRIDATDNEDAAGGDATLSYDDFSRLLLHADQRSSIRQASASFRTKLQKTTSEKLIDSTPTSALPTGIAQKGDTPHESYPADFLSSEMPDILAVDPKSKKSTCLREVFPLRVKSGRHYSFDEVVARIDEYNSQVRPSREKIDSRVRYCVSENRPATCLAFVSRNQATSSHPQRDQRFASAAFAAPRSRMDPPPAPFTKRGASQQPRFPSLEEKRKELMRSIPKKSVDDFVQTSKCFLRPDERGEVMMKYIAAADRNKSIGTEYPLIKERARTALAHLFPTVQ